MKQNTERSESLISTARHKYEGRWLKSGDPFMATPGDAADLIAMSFATRAPARIHTADMTAESETGATTEPRTKRAYNRRDMTAER